MPLISPGEPNFVVLWSRPSALYDSGGVTLKDLIHTNYSYQDTPADGDRFKVYFIANGKETNLYLTCYATSNSGIFDLYVNGSLDSSGYDNYTGGTGTLFRNITLSRPILKGKNIIELRVNSKNALSSDYLVVIYGASLT